MTVIEGTLRAEGAEVAAADLLLLDGDGEVTAAAQATPGPFRIDGDGAWVLARVEDGPVAAASAPAGEDVVLSGPFARVTVAVPEPLTLFLDPLALDALPEPVAGAAKARRPGVSKGHFRELELPAGESVLTVQHGRWRIGGSRIVSEEPLSPEGPPRSVIVDGIGGAQGNEWAGFDVTVEADLRLELSVRELAPDEL